MAEALPSVDVLADELLTVIREHPDGLIGPDAAIGLNAAYNRLWCALHSEVERRELLCQRCGREHPVWFAPNAAWNPVVRRENGSDEFPFLCPTCFIVLAEERGVMPVGGWLVEPRPERENGGNLQLRAAEAAEELGWNEGRSNEYEAFIAGWWTCWKREVSG